MTDTNMSIHKVTELPATLEKNALYLLKDNNENANLIVIDKDANKQYSASSPIITLNDTRVAFEIRRATLPALSRPVSNFFEIPYNADTRFTITDYSSSIDYTITASNGTINIENNEIIYNPGEIIGEVDFLINDRKVILSVQEPVIFKPTLVSGPIENSLVDGPVTITLSEFSSEKDNYYTHSKTIWNISYLDNNILINDFRTIDSGDLTTITLSDLLFNTKYIISAVYYSDTDNHSDLTNELVSFKTVMEPTVIGPVFSWKTVMGTTYWSPGDAAYVNNTYIGFSSIGDAIVPKQALLDLNAIEIRISYTVVDGQSSPSIGWDYFPPRDVGTWIDTMIIAGPQIEYIMLDSADSGLYDAIITNIEIYSQDS